MENQTSEIPRSVCDKWTSKERHRCNKKSLPVLVLCPVLFFRLQHLYTTKVNIVLCLQKPYIV